MGTIVVVSPGKAGSERPPRIRVTFDRALCSSRPAARHLRKAPSWLMPASSRSARRAVCTVSPAAWLGRTRPTIRRPPS